MDEPELRNGHPDNVYMDYSEPINGLMHKEVSRTRINQMAGGIAMDTCLLSFQGWMGFGYLSFPIPARADAKILGTNPVLIVQPPHP